MFVLYQRSKMVFKTAAALFLVFSTAQAAFDEAKVTELTSENFVSTVQEGPWFVEMYAPWCGHCKNLVPTWNELGYKLDGEIHVGKIDCVEHKGEWLVAFGFRVLTFWQDICSEYNVRGFPTLKMQVFNEVSD
jgi:thioredoxin-like negative regulator of GroEL